MLGLDVVSIIRLRKDDWRLILELITDVMAVNRTNVVNYLFPRYSCGVCRSSLTVFEDMVPKGTTQSFGLRRRSTGVIMTPAAAFAAATTISTSSTATSATSSAHDYLPIFACYYT